MREIRIAEVPQYGVLIENQYGKGQSLFHEVYEGAIENVADIILKNNTQPVGECLQNGFEKNINTIIAFVGGRGTGKSSAMCSFANYLNDNGKNTGVYRNAAAYSWITSGNAKTVIERTNFYSLPVIDSSQLSEKETVIGRITAAMYREYSDKFLSSATVEQKQFFIRLAKEVNEIAVLQRNGEWFVRGDKLLSDTERISNMSDKVSNLIEAFFAVAGLDKSTYLVVSIDDLDMGIGNTYAIMEEIRKFLFIKNVIVLITVDDKLLDSVLCSTFDHVLKAEHQPCSSITRNLSYRYLEKMFPYNRQHHMPRLTLDQLNEISASNFLGDADKNWGNTGLCNCLDVVGNNSPYPPLYDEKTHPSVLEAVLHLIWRKTMLLLVCDKEGNHLLIPRNLRSLCNMVIFLRSMEDVAYAKSKEENGKVTLRSDLEAFCGHDNASVRETIDHNLTEFGQYLVNNISSYGQLDLTHGDEKLARVLRDLIGNLLMIQLTKMNAKIVGDILQCILEEGETNLYYSLFFSKKDPDALLDAATRYPESISLGDVLYVLGKLDSKSRCEYIRYLVEIIRVLWSVRMTKEFYVNGCEQDAHKNKMFNESLSITENYRTVVGNLIVYPNTSVFCKYNGKVRKDDWIFISKQKATVDRMGERLADLLTIDSTFNLEYKQRVRKELNTNKLAHPMAIFVNLLKKSAEPQVYIMPFFSLDYMYRFYENMRRFVDEKMHKDLLSAINSWFTEYDYSGVDLKATAYNALALNMYRYIPYVYAKSAISDPMDRLKKVVEEAINDRSALNIVITNISKLANSESAPRTFSRKLFEYLTQLSAILKAAGHSVTFELSFEAVAQVKKMSSINEFIESKPTLSSDEKQQIKTALKNAIQNLKEQGVWGKPCDK